MRLFPTTFTLTSITAIAALILPVAPGNSQVQTPYKLVPSAQARLGSVDLEVYPGRSSTIDFSALEERVTYINIGDRSRIVVNTDAEAEEGTATTIFVRPIQPLFFPGATTTAITNLAIKTINSNGEEYLYNFEVSHNYGEPDSLGVKIVPLALLTPEVSTIKYTNLTSQTSQHSNKLNDIEQGLTIAIIKGYTSEGDPIVETVRQFIALANQYPNLSLETIAEELQIADIVNELQLIALELKQVDPNESTVVTEGEEEYEPTGTGTLSNSPSVRIR